MNKQKATMGAAAAGVLAGAVGLTLVAMPAGAGPAPSLPKTSPEALVQSVMTAKPVAFGGTVSATNNLGIPIPGVSPTSDGDFQGKVYSDGAKKARASFEQNGDQTTFVDDGTTAWTYNSKDRSVSKTAIPAGAAGKHEKQQATQDPAAMAKQMITSVKQYSTVDIDGTADVAGRKAYELVLTPKPSEKTLLREIRVAVDSATRMPLRMEVFGNGQNTPAVAVGFSQLNVGQQDPALFKFTPPQGAKVTTTDARKEAMKHGAEHKGAQHKGAQQNGAGLANGKVVGEGWDAVVTGTLPKDALSGKAKQGDSNGPRGKSTDLSGMLDKVSKPVSGPFGTGRIVSTSVGNALLTSDGRYAVGFVPEQVLAAALGGHK
jgi:outer membrane lipoprotein-sorting protein